MKIVLASRNAHKIKELYAFISPIDPSIEILSLDDIGFVGDIEEDGTTFEENALLKAKAVMEATGMAAIADDSGLMVDALDGAPGVYSARYGFDDTLDDWGRLLLLLKSLRRNISQVLKPRKVQLVRNNGSIVDEKSS